MKAVNVRKYGSPEVLQLAEVPKPCPRENELLVKVHAASVTTGDVRLRSSDFPPLFWLPIRLLFGLTRPRKSIPGTEFAGVVEGVGKKVTRYKIGDELFGTTTMLRSGAYGEYVCVPEEWKMGMICKKPRNLTFVEAATVPVGANTALFLLRKANVERGQKVLIYGASGSVGSYSVQLSRYFGADVTGVCSTNNIEMVKSLGAERVIDYTKDDLATIAGDFDVIFDAVGKLQPTIRRKLTKNGSTYVAITSPTQEKPENLEFLKDLVEKKHLKPFIDRIYTLDNIVEAHEHCDKGHKRGNIGIKVI